MCDVAGIQTESKLAPSQRKSGIDQTSWLLFELSKSSKSQLLNRLGIFQESGD